MARKNRPEPLLTSQGRAIETDPVQWILNASRAGTAYIRYVGYARPGTESSDAGWLIFENTYDATGTMVRKRVGSEKDQADFDQIWDDSSGIAITSITKAANAVVTTTAPHGLSTDDIIEITGSDATEANGDGYGSIIYTITVTAPTTFQLNISSLGWGAGGTAAGNCFLRTYLNATYA